MKYQIVINDMKAPCYPIEKIARGIIKNKEHALTIASAILRSKHYPVGTIATVVELDSVTEQFSHAVAYASKAKEMQPGLKYHVVIH